MSTTPHSFAVVGAGINGLVAANYLARAGHRVTLFERKDHVGGACVAATADIAGVTQDYALGASTLGLMQDFVWRDTGLADRLHIEPVRHPDLAFFPGDVQPAVIHDDEVQLQQALAAAWGERGDVGAFSADQGRVVRFLQDGYRAGKPPTVDDAIAALGRELAELWITGSAKTLLDHYLTADRSKVLFGMDVMESGPVSIDEPYSAFILPMMASGSVMDGYYGYVRGGIWQITRELERINRALGVDIHLSCVLHEVDAGTGSIRYATADGPASLQADHVVFATDPQTAARLIGDQALVDQTAGERVTGTSGKLNLMFRKPVQWKAGPRHAESDTAFRHIFAVETLHDLEAASQAAGGGQPFAPGYYQIYCEGAAMRHMGLDEPFERLAVFFKNLALGSTGEELASVEDEVKAVILGHVANPQDCAWSRLLTPRDLQHTFGFPGGNIEHTMLGDGQSYHDRQYGAGDTGRRFYQFGSHDTVSICGSSTYPCGSVAGTPAYMCVSELLRRIGH